MKRYSILDYHNAEKYLACATLEDVITALDTCKWLRGIQVSVYDNVEKRYIPDSELRNLKNTMGR